MELYIIIRRIQCAQKKARVKAKDAIRIRDEIMSEAMPVKNAERNLERLLQGLSFGESITLTGPEGGPVALLVSLKPGKMERKQASDWDARLDDLARKVSQAWKGEKSAVEVLSEMRR